MDATIVEYLKQHTASFADDSLNEVDSLVLSTVAYFRFEEALPGRSPEKARIALPLALCGITSDSLFSVGWLSRYNGPQFLAALLASPRFMQVDAAFYVSDKSEGAEKQFGAMMFLLPGNAAYIAFRGTDDSLAGWKEDLNISFMDEVPSHTSARNYLERFAACTVGPLYIGGHSKGGNLAEYAALTCDDATFGRITAIFNHDGPGFIDRPSLRIHTPEYESKLAKTGAAGSPVGLLMETRPYRLVRAKGISFTQHAPTNWIVEGNGFAPAESSTPDAQLFADTLNNWGRDLAASERQLVFDTLFDMLRASGATTLHDFDISKLSNIRAMLDAAVQLDGPTRQSMLELLLKLGSALRDEAARRIQETTRM